MIASYFLLSSGRLLVVTSQVVDDCKGELVLCAFIEFLVVVYEVLLVVFLMGEVEESSLEGSLCALERLPPNVIVEAEGVVASGLVDVAILIISLTQ
jgi:hypothetical protein